ncbi:MAG: hypothetical protein KJ000_00955 [Pirellulaceae bacterium]|nr:hypothetical protein [Pirellulaceae bacterium]
MAEESAEHGQHLSAINFSAQLLPSRPFDRPQTGKLAVKVINHYGDEVLKVFNV